MHEEICDDVRSHVEKGAKEHEAHFRLCVQAFDKTVANRNLKAQLEERKQQSGSQASGEEESGSEILEEQIPDDPIEEEAGSEDSEEKTLDDISSVKRSTKV